MSTPRSMTPPAARPGPRGPHGSHEVRGPRGPRGPCSVLLVEHEPDVAEMSARYLRRDGLVVRLVTTPEQALAELTQGQDAASCFDLTVLDLTMPGLDPRRIRRALRTPVIFLAAGPQGPRPRGLSRGPAGPRRWLTRPFGPRQLVAMTRDVLAEASRAPVGADLAGADLASADLASAVKTAGQAGGTLRLTPAESAILAALLEQPGRVLSRRQLLAATGRQAAGDRAADVYIAQLRAKLGAAGKAGAIRTVRGAGYVADP